MNWLTLTFLSIISRSFYGLMTKVLSNKVKVSIYTQACLLSLAGAVITFIFSPLIGGFSFITSDVNIVTLILVVLGQGLGNIVYFASIQHLTNATAQIAFSSILLFNTILALLFLNLHLNVFNILGIVTLLTAILSVINGKVAYHKKGIFLMLLAAFLFAIFQLASSELSKQVSASAYLLIAYLGSSIVVFSLNAKVILKDISSSTDYSTLFGVPFLTAVPSIGNFLFAYYAYRIAPHPAKVAMLLSSQIVLTVILSYYFLNEKANIRRNIIAGLLVILSAILIKN